MRTIVEVLFLVVLFIASNASAAIQEEKCSDEIYEIVGHDMKIEAFMQNNRVDKFASETCKTWPYNENLILSAIAYDDGVEEEKQLVVAIIDKRTLRVVSSYQSVIQEDATTRVRQDFLRLDTAPYQLAKGVRAFGLRFGNSSFSRSCPDGAFGYELNLLVPEGKKLRLVLSLDTAQQRAINGCVGSDTSEATWQDANLTIGLEKTSTNGFRDLRITATVKTSSNPAPLEETKATMEHHVMRYNGKTYDKGNGLPWWLGF